MKKLFISILTVVSFVQLTYGQGKAEMNLERGCQLIGSVGFTNGLVLLTSREYYLNTNLDTKITYYWPDLTQRYLVTVEKPRYNYFAASALVVSPSGNHVYYIRSKGIGNSGGNTQTVFQIDSIGAWKKYDVKRAFKYSKINAVFADDEFLYFVTREKNRDRSIKKKFRKPLLQFVKVAHDQTVTKVMLDLPRPDDDASEWSYLGHTTEVSYFVSRKLDDYNKESYRIGVIDHDGKLLDDFTLKTEIKNGDFRASKNHSSAAGSDIVDSHNYDEHSSSYTSGSVTYTTTSYTPTIEAFGDIKFDPLTGGFYIYGLSGPHFVQSYKMFAKIVRPVTNGYYVYRFDENGKEVWKYEGKLSVLNDFNTDKLGFMHRNMMLNVGYKGVTRLQVFAFNYAYTFEMNTETGKYITGYSNKFKNYVSVVDLGSCHKSGDKSTLGHFESSGMHGDFSQLNFRMTQSNIVLRNYYKDNKIELYSFGDN